MLLSRQWPLAALALLCLSASGCNGGPAPGVPGAPGQQGGQVAKSSPLKIPDVTKAPGAWLTDVETSLLTGKKLPGPDEPSYTGLIDQCGGTLCVTVKIVRKVDPGLQGPCKFITTNPPPAGTIYSGDVLTIYATPGPCQAVSSSP